jgi:hypothetical protein
MSTKLPGLQLSICVETIGICVICCGLATEAITGADVGYMIITGGSCIMATGSLIFAKLYKANKEDSDGK